MAHFSFVVEDTFSSHNDVQAKLKGYMMVKIWFSYFAEIPELSMLRIGGFKSGLVKRTKTSLFSDHLLVLLVVQTIKVKSLRPELAKVSFNVIRSTSIYF